MYFTFVMFPRGIGKTGLIVVGTAVKTLDPRSTLRVSHCGSDSAGPEATVESELEWRWAQNVLYVLWWCTQGSPKRGRKSWHS